MACLATGKRETVHGACLVDLQTVSTLGTAVGGSWRSAGRYFSGKGIALRAAGLRFSPTSNTSVSTGSIEHLLVLVWSASSTTRQSQRRQVM